MFAHCREDRCDADNDHGIDEEPPNGYSEELQWLVIAVVDPPSEHVNWNRFETRCKHDSYSVVRHDLLDAHALLELLHQERNPDTEVRHVQQDEIDRNRPTEDLEGYVQP